LQHLVDLFGQFYEPMGPLLPRLLELLRGFIARSHASLASVGVAAYTRMVASCGTKLDSQAWQQVGCGCRDVADARFGYCLWLHVVC
jgi:brefeldin A-inhibited guanine nucleotide-exchange protein